MPFQTYCFRENQKVFIQKTTGSLAFKVIGRFRGKGKYCSAWVNFDKKKRQDLYPRIIDIEVKDYFAISKELEIVNA